MWYPGSGLDPSFAWPSHILAQCLTASSCEQGCSSHLSVSVLFLLLSSACFFIPKVTVQLNAHQLEP